MPIYEYKCSKCKRSFSVLQKTGTSEKDTVCPDCGSNAVKNCCPHSHVLLPEAIHSAPLLQAGHAVAAAVAEESLPAEP